MNPTTMRGWKIVVDTNVIFSLIHTQSPTIKAIILYILDEHHLLLPSYVIKELKEKVAEKMPGNADALDAFLDNPYIDILPDEADISEIADVVLRDAKDLPVLYAAIQNEADALLTGDYDFLHMKGKNELPVMILSIDEFVWIFGEAGLNKYLL